MKARDPGNKLESGDVNLEGNGDIHFIVQSGLDGAVHIDI